MNQFLFKYKCEFNVMLKGSVTLGGRVPRLLACGLVVCQLVGAAYAQVWKSNDVPECTEYLPKGDSRGVCHVTITIPEIKPGANPTNAAPTHADVALRPNVVAGVILRNASPLMSCSLTASPAVLTRDPSTSITTFISTLATLGLPGGALGAAPALAEIQLNSLSELSIQRMQQLPPAAAAEAKQIESKKEEAEAALNKPQQSYNQALKDYQQARATVMANWKYDYPNDKEFKVAAKKIYADLSKALADPLPTGDDLKALNKTVEPLEKQIEAQLETFRAKYQDSASQSWYEVAESRLSEIKTKRQALPSEVQFLNDLQALLKPAFTWLNAKSNPPGSGSFEVKPGDENQHDMTTVYLPMSRYAQKQVTEAITCKDAASKDPAFDTITFTAYYEPAASWDFSAAAFLSLLPGRQLGTYTQSQPAGTTMAGPSILAATTQSSHQFIPGAVFELHPGPMNFRCPWAEDWPSRAKEGTGYHPWGYVCSIGPAVGFLVNPNSGTTQAEFFEGISFGIHRLAILVGNHTGRFEEFADGYALGQTVPAGTMPATTRRWTNHPAIGISYRIPIR